MLRIGCFGAGGLLQDLIIIGKLIQKGFKNITVFFVDPKVDSNNVKEFELMLNKLKGVTVRALCPPFFGPKMKLDAIYSTDLDDLNHSEGDCWSSVFWAKNALTDTGKFYLFGDNTALILDKNDHLQDLLQGADTFFEKFLVPSKLPDWSNVAKIKVIAAKDNRQKLNFNCPRLAKVVQILFKQFGKPIDLQLYGNEIFPSAYRLNADANSKVLKSLSGKEDVLSVEYHKEACSLQQQAQAAYHVFVRELENGDANVSFKAN
jgi:hypothetical protein